MIVTRVRDDAITHGFVQALGSVVERPGERSDSLATFLVQFLTYRVMAVLKIAHACDELATVGVEVLNIGHY
jgi:hypothetical protein